jgi:menaquinone-dependent protoporphyrinogen oxidase
MSRLLIVYGTRQGHTGAIAECVAQALRTDDHQVDVRDLRCNRSASLRDYDGVIVGASVHARGFEREVIQWATTHADELAVMPNAFFSVSLTSANPDEKHTAQINEVIQTFVSKTHWQPELVGRFAGAVAYSQYNWFLKRVIRGIVRHEGEGNYTDMRRDYDLTDYDDVADFAREFATRVALGAIASNLAP